MSINVLSSMVALQHHDLPAELPQPRGPMTDALLDCLRRDPASTRVKPARLAWSGATAEAATDHDLQLALWLAYELPYRGLAGVDDAWESHPGLIEVIEEWEDLLFEALVNLTSDCSPAASPSTRCGPPLFSHALMAEATLDQFRELLIHRSVCYLKEADPLTWGIPRLSASEPAIPMQAGQDGWGRTGTVNAQLFRSVLSDWGLDTRYGRYLDCVPGITLLTSNMISMFGRHRRFRAALVGHLAMFEGSDHLVDEKVLGEDLLFGARCAAYAAEQFAAWVLPRWAAGQTSLLQEIGDAAS
jgi:hypothetical protein